MKIKIKVNNIDIKNDSKFLNAFEKLSVVINNGRVVISKDEAGNKNKMNVVLATEQNKEIFLDILRKNFIIISNESNKASIRAVEDYTIEQEDCRIYFSTPLYIQELLDLVDSYIKKENESIINKKVDILFKNI